MPLAGLEVHSRHFAATPVPLPVPNAASDCFSRIISRLLGCVSSDAGAKTVSSLQSRSATAFLLGVGAGSVSLISHLSGWTLTSISGFSTAFARVLEVRPCLCLCLCYPTTAAVAVVGLPG